MVVGFVKKASEPVDFVPRFLAEAPYRFNEFRAGGSVAARNCRVGKRSRRQAMVAQRCDQAFSIRLLEIFLNNVSLKEKPSAVGSDGLRVRAHAVGVHRAYAKRGINFSHDTFCK